MKKFFNGLLVLILLVIIVGGVGYIGYSYLFMDHTGMNMASMQGSQTDQSNNNSQTQSGMQHGNSGNQPQQNEVNQQTQSNNSLAVSQSVTILKNKESLSNAITDLNDTLEYLTLDPYGSSRKDGMAKDNTTISQDSGTSESKSTTINIYPQNNNTVNVVPPNDAGNSSQQPDSIGMQNMGAVYDAAKMEQLHKGLYNLAVGKAMLDQLSNDFSSQAGHANTNIQDPVQFYSNQYNLTQQNKSKLSSALNYINDAAGLVNINPYVSPQGLIYDQERMSQIRQSVFKLAESVVALNLLSDD
ncbi:MAG TPA: hypothetical protein VM577_10420, partial [Anaerovoracaceae bacterium]|nr:hypothetical protein [Anaerovoracaceae bacterium]